MKDYYQILGVSRGASSDEIKQAYRSLAHKHHPDKGGDEKKFKEINEAYQILSDKDKKSQYDNFGQVNENGAGQGGFEGWDFGSAWNSNRGGQGGFEFDLGDMGIGDILEEMFGFGSSPKRKKDFKKGKNIEVSLEIPLEDVLKGKEKEISLQKPITCSRCQGIGAEPGSSVKECFSCRGIGQVQQIKRTPLGSFTSVATCPECGGEGFKPEKPCNVCKGEGRVKGKDDIKIFIPAGVDSNQAIKVEGKGEAGRKGGKPGDLYVRIYVKEHPVFARKGDDLYVTMPITFSQAALGDEIEVPVLGGTKILLNVSAGVESGKVLRISQKGITHFAGSGRGDMYVELKIRTPKKLTRRQKELLEELKKEEM
ncbi:MAG: molecular chaperone DnaJ [Candidatus Nealsonbacteria bacterium]|nr:molecular chaperone DnaJ [Candidatus Nealsonbacteria bacterium]